MKAYLILYKYMKNDTPEYRVYIKQVSCIIW